MTVASLNVSFSSSASSTQPPLKAESSDILVYVEIADDIQEQIDGLMFRGSLEWDSGMIFVYKYLFIR